MDLSNLISILSINNIFDTKLNDISLDDLILDNILILDNEILARMDKL